MSTRDESEIIVVIELLHNILTEYVSEETQHRQQQLNSIELMYDGRMVQYNSRASWGSTLRQMRKALSEKEKKIV